MKRSNYSI